MNGLAMRPQEPTPEMLEAASTIIQSHGARLVWGRMWEAAPKVPGMRVLRIPRSESLDPVTVYVEEFEQGAGRATIVCYNQAWTCYWGSMGRRDLVTFVAGCDRFYVAGNMLTGRRNKVPAHEQFYVERVAQAFIDECARLKVAELGGDHG